MYLKKILLAFFILNTTYLSVYSQNDSIPLTTIVTKTAKFITGRPIEKVYLHFDKPYYAVGDTIWFKAYLTANLHEPSILSKIVYVDLFSSQDTLVASLKLPVFNGVAWGNIILPQLTFKQGNYHVRAYTAWMRNSDPVYFFNKTIPVGNVADEQVLPQIAFSNNVTANATKINAFITYKDQDGSPYFNRKVSWKALLDDETIGKGKGVTDANGRIAITFSGDKLSNLSPGNIESTLEVNAKRSFTNSFPILIDDKSKDVQFFPEGGDLITGVRSRVAIKIVKPEGLGIDAKGVVTDNNGTKVADIQTSHLGMGEFILVPEPDKSYKAILTFADATTGTFDLPRSKSGAVNLAVSNIDPQNITIKISSGVAFFDKNKGHTLYVVGQSGGNIYFAAQTVLSSPLYTANISKSKFPTGILQLTLFSSAGEPLSERLIFIQHHDQLNLKINSDLKTYKARGHVKLNISAKNGTQPALSSCSVAVTDENKVPINENAETTILSSLLLTSDLRGYVEQPNYYFLKDDTTTNTNLDILMLTQGYRRFSFKNILKDKIPPLFFLPEQGIDISGTLRTLAGVPVFKGNLRLLIPDHNFSAETITNADGLFKFSGLSFRDSSQVTISARNNVNNKNLMITVNGDSYQAPTKNFTKPDEIANIDSMFSTYLANSKKQYSNTRVLKEVVIKSTSAEKRPSHEDFPALSGLGQVDQLIAGDQLKNCGPSLLICLQGTLLQLQYDNNNFYIRRDYTAGGRTPVGIFYNGGPVDISYLANIDPKDVESVEVFNNDGVSGLNRNTNTKGVLVVTGKKAPKGTKISLAELEELIPKQNVVTFMPRGFNLSREFYSPKYDAAKSSAVGIDLRSTIYWNPKVVTDKTGNASVDYYNADGKGTYRAVIEGIDSDGNIGRYIYRYKVE
jgi:hypothetical protein